LYCCAGCDARLCGDQQERAKVLPAHLSETGLYANIQGGELAAQVSSYTPEFTLWSDGADKRRFISVPTGERIETHDPEAWIFPAGTKLWKEFSLDGRLLETRLFQKTGPNAGDWAAAAYVWRSDQSDAELAPYGALDVLGTGHDVPASGECFACHDGRVSRILGFSAIQLAPRSADAPPHVDVRASESLLSEPLATIDIPGTATERAALGYLHANCSHCHNQGSAARAQSKCLNPNQSLSFDLDFSLHVADLGSVQATATYRTAIGKVIRRGDPDGSKLIELMSKRSGGLGQMPPLATERVDQPNLDLLRGWIRAL